MKTLLILTLLTLDCFLLFRHVAAASFAMDELSRSSCCPEDIKPVIIPKRMVQRVEMSPDHCKTKAMIVTTKKNVVICVDPESKFAQKHLKDFLKSTPPPNSTTSSSTTSSSTTSSSKKN
ncbi:C-C motif chemokine 13-like [Mugil cephalus]|uniref:C-C motif chemokine 13-like n=1 Tax=Mugil cephalus TaxID=48193 RepID=UPI001FB8549D|nr:C-C motif chemokine 13-like [Mugil cephalus]